MSDHQETSESGAPIFRHKAVDRPLEPASGESSSNEITAHIEKHFGPITTVLHEIVSDIVHVDIQVVAPTPKRPLITLITTGMSDKPMTTPKGTEKFAFTELMMCLPKNWPLDQESMKDEKFYWPFRLMKTLARFPHEYKTWLFLDHTLPNGNPPEPYAPNVKFCCALLGGMHFAPKGFWELKISEEKNIYFLGIVTLFKEEMEFKLKKGAEALQKKLIENKVGEFLSPNRKPVCEKGWLGWK